MAETKRQYLTLPQKLEVVEKLKEVIEKIDEKSCYYRDDWNDLKVANWAPFPCTPGNVMGIRLEMFGSLVSRLPAQASASIDARLDSIEEMLKDHAQKTVAGINATAEGLRGLVEAINAVQQSMTALVEAMESAASVEHSGTDDDPGIPAWLADLQGRQEAAGIDLAEADPTLAGPPHAAPGDDPDGTPEPEAPKVIGGARKAPAR